tara:strand:+ start:160 stop:933 length:774 start_codon:yes stop_codon:yes gene_type:complete
MADKNDEIQEYYKLKNRYENSISKQKNKILKDKELSIKEKKDKINLINKKCVKCKNIGGTIFENKNNTLIALCGCDTPCKLNIVIEKTKHFNIRDEDIKIYNKINNLKAKIIKIKLDLIFKYEPEEICLKKFEEIKKELFHTTKYLLNIRKTYLNIISNQDKISNLDNLIYNLHSLILQIKELSKSYFEDQNDANIKTLIELYFNELQPLVENIRNTKYMHYEIKTTEKMSGLVDKVITYNLIQKPYSIGELYIPII